MASRWPLYTTYRLTIMLLMCNTIIVRKYALVQVTHALPWGGPLMLPNVDQWAGKVTVSPARTHNQNTWKKENNRWLISRTHARRAQRSLKSLLTGTHLSFESASRSITNPVKKLPHSAKMFKKTKKLAGDRCILKHSSIQDWNINSLYHRSPPPPSK